MPFTVPTQLKVYRPTGNASQFQAVGESSVDQVASGPNIFETRIPVQTGDHLGLFGSSSIGTLYCAEEPETENPGNVMGFFSGNPSPGSTATLLGAESELLVPAAAVIEPDADNDGFGDETQDKCPQSAAFQIPCPIITVDSVSVVGKTKVIVYVATNNEAPVKVGGVVKLGKGKAAKLSGGTKPVVPGKIAHFTLKFSKALKAALKELPASKKLTLKVTATATNVAGQISKDISKTKLKGQG